jgi:hypothetical protein
MNKIALSFIPDPLIVPVALLLPSKKLPLNMSSSRKYKQILESLRTIGLIEPLIISPTTDSGNHIVLDGHARLLALQELGANNVQCLISTDDETYTYNNRINRLSTVQEHLMIKRAISRGVSAEKLASSLNVDLTQIMRKVKLLDGICPEATKLLKDQVFPTKLSDILRKMKPTRQIECVELMISANTIKIPYAQALLAATPSHMLVETGRSKKFRGISPEQLLKMEREMGNLNEQYKLVEESYGQDVLNLVLAKGYLSKLIDNQEISRFIKQKQPDVYNEFINIIETVSMDK